MRDRESYHAIEEKLRMIESGSMSDASPTPAPESLSLLLQAWGSGDSQALATLTPLVYKELKRIARREMRAEHGPRTLQSTALVNEAWLRLADIKKMDWQHRAHFFGISARIMRRILVENARARLADKRGGHDVRITFDEALPVTAKDSQMVALDEALSTLAKFDERKAQVIELRFFGGLSVEETAHVLGVSEPTIHRDWRIARAWLLSELSRK